MLRRDEGARLCALIDAKLPSRKDIECGLENAFDEVVADMRLAPGSYVYAGIWTSAKEVSIGNCTDLEGGKMNDPKMITTGCTFLLYHQELSPGVGPGSRHGIHCLSK